MFERFTESARIVVTGAQDEARQLGTGYIGTEHLLLALLNPASGRPAWTGTAW
jgi:ATP-dependent Clp protease ATP-binding subunit ClpC